MITYTYNGISVDLNVINKKYVSFLNDIIKRCTFANKTNICKQSTFYFNKKSSAFNVFITNINPHVLTLLTYVFEKMIT